MTDHHDQAVVAACRAQLWLSRQNLPSFAFTPCSRPVDKQRVSHGLAGLKLADVELCAEGPLCNGLPTPASQVLSVSIPYTSLYERKDSSSEGRVSPWPLVNLSA